MEENGEVDFVIKNKDQTLSAINVTYTDEIDKIEINRLLEFKKGFNKVKELIILNKNLEKEEKVNGQKIKFIPLWKWLLIFQ